MLLAASRYKEDVCVPGAAGSWCLSGMPPPCPHHGEGGGDGPPGGGVQQGNARLLPPDEVYQQKVFLRIIIEKDVPVGPDDTNS